MRFFLSSLVLCLEGCVEKTPLPQPDAGGDGDADADADADGDADADADGDLDGGGGRSCETASYSEVKGCASIIGTPLECEGRRHADGPDAGPLVLSWSTNPPASGDHLRMWETERGEHAEEVFRGNWVHNLEHGWVVLLHNCPTPCDAELQVLRDVITQRSEARILMTPDPLLDPPRFAAVSWTWVYETDAPDLATLLCFVDQHEGHGPEDVH